MEKELDLIRSAVLPRLEGGMVETAARILATNQSMIIIPKTTSSSCMLSSSTVTQSY